MVVLLRLSSHAVSFGDREEAPRTEGLCSAGHVIAVGVYPFGELGRALRSAGE